MLAWLPSGVSTDVARNIRATTELSLVLLSEMRQVQGQGDREAFVVGFAGFSLEEIEKGANALGRAVVDQLSQGVPAA